jgi:hypothetical protein
MRGMVLSLCACVVCSTAFGELSRDALKRLEDVEISGVREDTYKDDDHKKYEMLEINTFQNEDDREGFRIYIVVELEDKYKTKYLTGFKAAQPGGMSSDYTGEDYWKFYIPHGEMERLKITAYAVLYGIMDGNQFILLAEDYDGVKSIDEFRGHQYVSFPGKVRLMHCYMYNDSASGDTESYYKTLPELK